MFFDELLELRVASTCGAVREERDVVGVVPEPRVAGVESGEGVVPRVVSRRPALFYT